MSHDNQRHDDDDDGEASIDRADEDLTQDAPPPVDVLLPVQVVGPVRVQEVAVYIPATRNSVLGPNEISQILGGDPRRSHSYIVSTATDIYVGTSRGQVAAGTAAVWPAGYPLVWRGRNEVWVRNASETTETRVSIITEDLQ